MCCVHKSPSVEIFAAQVDDIVAVVNTQLPASSRLGSRRPFLSSFSVKTFSTFAPFKTRSGFSRPIATSINHFHTLTAFHRKVVCG